MDIQPTKQEIREEFLKISVFVKYRYNIDMEAIYDKYNNNLPYHNKEHAEAFLYYTDLFSRKNFIKVHFNKEERYYLLIAAYLHDVGHKGHENKGKDCLNIKIAQNIINEEFKGILCQENIDLINKYISFTQFPYDEQNIITDEDYTIASVLRAADMSQIFISDIDVYSLCYNLHHLELKNEIADEKLFMQDQYNFYKTIADKNKIFNEYFKILDKKIFKKWI